MTGKYMVLFTPESVDPSDDSLKGRYHDMLFGYPDEKSGWKFNTAAAAYKEAVANEYRPGIDFIVVRVLASKVKTVKK